MLQINYPVGKNRNSSLSFRPTAAANQPPIVKLETGTAPDVNQRTFAIYQRFPGKHSPINATNGYEKKARSNLELTPTWKAVPDQSTYEEQEVKMGTMKTIALAGLFSLTLSSAVFATAPFIQSAAHQTYPSSTTRTRVQKAAKHTPVQRQYSSQPSNSRVIKFADSPVVRQPQVSGTTATTTLRKPQIVQPQANTSSNTQPVERVARRPADSKPTVRSLMTLGPNDDIVELVNNARGTVLIDFYADWCAPCRKQGEILAGMETTASQLNASIIKVNVDRHRELAIKLDVESLPTILVVKDGQLISRHSGIADRDRVKALLSQ